MTSAADKLAAIERELGYRRRVYARRVEDGKMSEAFAREQIGIFEDIAADYRGAIERERLL